jgi:hypothetical protein
LENELKTLPEAERTRIIWLPCARVTARSAFTPGRSDDDMKIYQESKVLGDVRRIKEEISKEAARLGREKFYLSLNGTAARLMAKYRTKKRKAACR